MAELGLMSDGDSWQPVIRHIAATNTFDSDWPTLKQHIHSALSASFESYAQAGKPVSRWETIVDRVGPYTYPKPPKPPPKPEEKKEEKKDDKPPSDSLLLSPTNSTSQLEKEGQLAEDPDPNNDQAYLEQYGLLPSTPGGLVLAPFPPQPPRVKDIWGTGLSANGAKPHPRWADPEWNEDVVIGGKVFPGYLEEEDAKREVERVGKLLDELEEYVNSLYLADSRPPFTIQRLAELLLEPRKEHATLGKFLRAVEKTLLVTSAWEAPSYDYTPAATLPGGGFLTRSSSFSSVADSDEESLMPPGASTPMFSPIPFLRHHTIEGLSMEVEDDRPMDDGLMSPLSIGARDGVFHPESFAVRPLETDEEAPSSSPPEEGPSSPDAEANARSPAPEPEDALPIGGETQDPGNQSYLGRVDELDTGPISSMNGESRAGEGESGTMTPHGMSDHPVALSSTTVIAEEERRIASLPRSQNREQ